MANILLAITGLNPQVITETLYALHQEDVAVDEIHVITTQIGCDCISAHLLAPNHGKYYRYLQEYDIDPNSINFSHQTLHVLRDEQGNPLEDITDLEENEILLKTCLTLAHRLTCESGDTVFFSIAGGRKTMSACLMVAAQMYGRPQDRIYHILVSPEFEGHRAFYYPPVKPVMLELRNAQGQKIFKETSYAKVTLVPIPFISVRPGRVKTPAQILRYLIKEKTRPLIVDLSQGRIFYKKTELNMMPSRLALYAFFIRQKLQCLDVRTGCRGCTKCYLDFQQISDRQQIINAFYRSLGGITENKGICVLDKETLHTYVSKIRQDIQQAYGIATAAELSLESIGKKPDTRYGIRMERGEIKLIT